MSADSHELSSGIGLAAEPPLSPPVVNKSGIAHEPAPEIDLSTLGVTLRPPDAQRPPEPDAPEDEPELEPALPAAAAAPEPEPPVAAPEPDLPAMGPETQPFDLGTSTAAPEPRPADLLTAGTTAAGAKTFTVVVRLMDGNGVEVGEFKDFGTAMEGAQEVIEQFTGANGSWPFYAGRFIRPDLIVSVDLVAGL